MEDQKSGIKVIYENNISIIEFSHTNSNSLPISILNDLSAKIDGENKNDTSILLLKSSGDRSFCAGASFMDLMEIKNKAEGKEFFMGFAKVINSMRKSNKIIIGRIQGKSVGGGVGLASACDFSFATKFSSIKLSELELGIGPFVVGPAVERKIGVSAYNQMTLQSDTWFDANWAHNKGLFHNISENIEEMDKNILEFINKLSLKNKDSIIKIKKIFWENYNNWDTLLAERAEISGELVLSEFTKNYILNFKEKAKL